MKRECTNIILVLILGATSLYLTASLAQLARDLGLLNDLQMRRTLNKPG